MQENTLDIIKRDFYPDKDINEIKNLMKHFFFANDLIQAGPSLFIDGLQGSIPAFLEIFNDCIDAFNYISEGTTHSYGRLFLKTDEKSKQITDENEKKSLNLIASNLRDMYAYESRSNNDDIPTKEKEFLDFLKKYGVYTPGKEISNHDRDGVIDMKAIISEDEAKKIDELYNKNKGSFGYRATNINIDEFEPYLKRAEEIGSKYDLAFLNVSLLDMLDTENLSNKLDEIESTFHNFKERFHLDNNSVGYGKLGYIFDKSLITEKNELAHFSSFSQESYNCGAIRLKSTLDHNQENIRIIDHEYAHAIDRYVSKNMGMRGFFSELPLEDQMKNPKALEALRKIVYSVSDLENEYLTIDEANQSAFEFNKDMFKTLLIHSFELEEYSKLDQNKINQVINDNKEKVVKIFDAISWLSLENKKELKSNFLNDFSETNAFSNFYTLYNQIGGKLSKNEFLASLEEPLDIIKDNIYEYNIKRDIYLNTFFNNPSDFAKDIANVAINIKTYTKESTERLAWAVGGTDKEDIIPGVLQGFKDFCAASDIQVDNTKVLNKEDLSKKLKDLKQLKMPSYLYTIKYDG